MEDAQRTAREFVESTPDGEDVLAELVSVDAEGVWDFDDVALGTGVFGEIVSRGIVEQTDDGYRLANREAVEAVLRGETVDTADDDDGPERDLTGLVRGAVAARRRLLAVLGAAVLFVVLVRVVLMVGSVFRGGTVVLAGNDPYQYAYWVEQVVSRTPGPEVSQYVQSREFLFIQTMGLIAGLLGGSSSVTTVLALYPVVVAALSGLLVYSLAARVSGDRRVGIAAIALLAVVPGHAFRTALGFADHHAFDSLWMILTATGLSALYTSERPNEGELFSPHAWRSPAMIGGVVAVATGVAAQVLSWRGGPLFLVPVVGSALVFVALDIVSDRSALAGNAHLLLALVAATGLGLGTHLLFGAAQLFRVAAPGIAVLVLVGAAGLADGLRSAGQSKRTTVLATAGISAVLPVLVMATIPGFLSRLGFYVGFLTRQDGIAENTSIFSSQLGSIVGPVFVFGLLLFVALPYAIWATRRVVASHEQQWVTPVVYFWVLSGLVLFQLRYGLHLALFVAAFAGLGFVHLAAVVVDFERPSVLGGDREAGDSGGGPTSELSIPSRQTLGTLALVFLLVGGLGFIQTAVKQHQVKTSDSTYRTAAWIDDHAATNNVTYPDNYVFSWWGENRVYNYFVSGQSRSYAFARENYNRFRLSTAPDRWYERLASRVGYIVTTPASGDTASGTINERLYRLGESGGGERLAHYRLVYADRPSDKRVFDLVPGATVTGVGAPNATATVSTEVSVPNATFTYQRRVNTTMTGRFAVTVPYSGTYDLPNGTSTVTEATIERGAFAGPKRPVGTWQFDSGRGDVAFDTSGGNHGFLDGVRWVAGADGRAVGFGGDRSSVVTIPEQGRLDGGREFTVAVRFRTEGTTSTTPDRTDPRVVANTPSSAYQRTDGYQIAVRGGRLVAGVGDGTDGARLNGPAVDDGQWHTAALVRDGDDVRLYVDGTEADDGTFGGTLSNDVPLTVGAFRNGDSGFVGRVDALRIVDRVADGGRILQGDNE